MIIKWHRFLTPWVLTLVTMGISGNVLARPAAVFLPYLEQIQDSLPMGLTMRLPSDIIASEIPEFDPEKLVVRWFASEHPLRFNVSVFTCEQGPLPCLLASFSVERANSETAQQELANHREKGDRITLVKNANIYGYLIEGNDKFPTPTFSTVMWQQDYMIYTVSMPMKERQNLLYLAYWMAQNDPIRPK